MPAKKPYTAKELESIRVQIIEAEKKFRGLNREEFVNASAESFILLERVAEFFSLSPMAAHILFFSLSDSLYDITEIRSILMSAKLIRVEIEDMEKLTNSEEGLGDKTKH